MKHYEAKITLDIDSEFADQTTEYRFERAVSDLLETLQSGGICKVRGFQSKIEQKK